jgi:hypothetical protein
MSCTADAIATFLSALFAVADGGDFSWFRTAKNFVGLKNPALTIPLNQVQ